MNKTLVSKNVVLKFKNGRAIKALKGTLFGRNTLYVYYTGRDGIDRYARYNPWSKNWEYANLNLKNWLLMPSDYVTHDGYNFNGDFATVSNLKNGISPKPLINNNSSNKSNISSKQQLKTQGKYNRKFGLNKELPSNNINEIYEDNNTEIKYSPTIALDWIDRKLNSPVYQENYPKSDTSYKSPGTPSSITQTKTITKNPKTEAILRKLISLGFLSGKGLEKADGIWGKRTLAAYLKYLDFLKAVAFNPDNIPEVEKKPDNQVLNTQVNTPGYSIAELFIKNNPTLKYASTFFKKGGRLNNPINKFKIKYITGI